MVRAVSEIKRAERLESRAVVDCGGRLQGRDVRLLPVRLGFLRFVPLTDGTPFTPGLKIAFMYGEGFVYAGKGYYETVYIIFVKENRKPVPQVADRSTLHLVYFSPRSCLLNTVHSCVRPC